ncbi:hypothetical protein F0U61_50175 [Archangium violaceum]|uniref:hypothetical protein n=1 Tax=Archangium violaceum TaxID=83451 RepID=UPI002B2CB82D|nr:hypothetical protein F0U61_50175 [Archangium violaceum]
MNPDVSGYIVVDKPRQEFPYRGVDRKPWEVVAGHFYEGRLPKEERSKFEQIKLREPRGFWLPVSREIGAAHELLAYSIANGAPCELIAVSSPYLSSLRFRAEASGRTLFRLGTDVISVGEWSLLKILQEHVLQDPSHPLPFILNEHGLLRDGRDVGTVESLYREWAELGRVEPIADVASGLPVEPVDVFLLE